MGGPRRGPPHCEGGIEFQDIQFEPRRVEVEKMLPPATGWNMAGPVLFYRHLMGPGLLFPTMYNTLGWRKIWAAVKPKCGHHGTIQKMEITNN